MLGTVFANLAWYRRTKYCVLQKVHLFENSLLKIMAQLSWFYLFSAAVLKVLGVPSILWVVIVDRRLVLQTTEPVLHTKSKALIIAISTHSQLTRTEIEVYSQIMKKIILLEYK